MVMCMALMQWQDALYRLGVEEMDHTHREFVDLANRLHGAPDEDFAALFDELIAHSEAHFANENRLMEESGFPPIGIHRGEHERVLGVLRLIRERLGAGELALARDFVTREIPEWFSQHAASMDTALALHLQGRFPLA